MRDQTLPMEERCKVRGCPWPQVRGGLCAIHWRYDNDYVPYLARERVPARASRRKGQPSEYTLE